MTRNKGKIDRSFFDDMLGEVEEASTPSGSAELPLNQIAPRADQFRRNFDQASIEALAASVSGQDLTSFFTAWLRTSGKPARTADNGLS